MQIPCKFGGRFEIRLNDRVIAVDNRITDQGLNFMGDGDPVITHLMLGSGDSPTVNQTLTLDDEILSVPTTPADGVGGGEVFVQITADNTDLLAGFTGTVQEIAVGRGSLVFARVALAEPLEVNEGDALTIIYKLSWQVGSLLGYTGTIPGWVRAFASSSLAGGTTYNFSLIQHQVGPSAFFTIWITLGFFAAIGTAGQLKSYSGGNCLVPGAALEIDDLVSVSSGIPPQAIYLGARSARIRFALGDFNSGEPITAQVTDLLSIAKVAYSPPLPMWSARIAEERRSYTYLDIEFSWGRA